MNYPGYIQKQHIIYNGYEDRVINTCECGFTLHIIDDDYDKREKKKA